MRNASFLPTAPCNASSTGFATSLFHRDPAQDRGCSFHGNAPVRSVPPHQYWETYHRRQYCYRREMRPVPPYGCLQPDHRTNAVPICTSRCASSTPRTRCGGAPRSAWPRSLFCPAFPVRRIRRRCFGGSPGPHFLDGSGQSTCRKMWHVLSCYAQPISRRMTLVYTAGIGQFGEAKSVSAGRP